MRNNKYRTEEIVKEEIEKLGFIYLGLDCDFKDYNTKISRIHVQSKLCRHKFWGSLDFLKRKTRKEKNRKKIPTLTCGKHDCKAKYEGYERLKHKRRLWVRERVTGILEESNSILYLPPGELIRNKNTIKLKCSHCGAEVNTWISNLSAAERFETRGINCKHCYQERADKRCKDQLPDEIEMLGDSWTIKGRRFVRLKCEIDNHIWVTQYSDIYQSGDYRIEKPSRCPVCAKSGFDYSKPAVLYYLRIELEDTIAYKVGITNGKTKKAAKRRAKQIHLKAEVVKWTWGEVGDYIYRMEQDILAKFSQHLFKDHDYLKELKSGKTECFNKDILEEMDVAWQ